jgi:hypothetical protein
MTETRTTAQEAKLPAHPKHTTISINSRHLEGHITYDKIKRTQAQEHATRAILCNLKPHKPHKHCHSNPFTARPAGLFTADKQDSMSTTGTL